MKPKETTISEKRYLNGTILNLPCMHSPKIFDYADLPVISPSFQTYSCRLLSPMFMYGTRNRKPTRPELREESFLGTLHYWYRALWGHALHLPEIRQREQALFGYTDKRGSAFVSITNKNLTEGEVSYKPHRQPEQNNSKRAFHSGTFEITVSADIAELFQLVVLLGGFGARSRRGFGSIEVVTTLPDDQTPFHVSLLQRLISFFKNPSLAITTEEGIRRITLPVNLAARGNNFPYVKTIYFREYPSADPALTTIHATASKMTHAYKSRYSQQLGGIGPRFASPVIASVVRNGEDIVPVITTLHNTRSSEQYLQFEYIRTVLSPS